MHIVNAHYLTVRNLPEDVAAALDREQRRRGTSLNQTVVDLLRLSLGVGSIRSNGLRPMAGTWTEAEHQEFLSRVQVFETIDADLWK